MLLLLEQHPGVRCSEAGRALAADFRRRLVLTSAISDALFGLTRALAPFADRLSSPCESVAALLAKSDQDIRMEVTLQTSCPPDLEEAVLRVAHELVGNAMKHGMYARVTGRIEVRRERDGRRIRLLVSDDGSGCADEPSPGEGLSLARLTAEREDGDVTIRSHAGRTLALLDLPIADQGQPD